MTPLDGEGNYYADLPDGPSGSGTGLPLQQPNDVIGSFSDPNGNVTPGNLTSPSFYYKDDAVISFWAWSVSGQNWLPIVT